MANNPHPDAGKLPTLLEVGAEQECIPCLALSRHKWHEATLVLRAKENDLRQLLEETTSALEEMVAEVKKVPAMNDRKYDDLGARVLTAIKHARTALQVICRSCKQEINPDVCYCGDSNNHGLSSNHSFVPMGCICEYQK